MNSKSVCSKNKNIYIFEQIEIWNSRLNLEREDEGKEEKRRKRKEKKKEKKRTREQGKEEEKKGEKKSKKEILSQDFLFRLAYFFSP